ncbi:MAG: RsmB/NOP family class I SAM-dependent RNA methyltransferase [Erysipelotrichaceae bacterium]|jgi:16S rRNA C967 or C1407 C5-methylase (RsmB/RsmF family)/NOL1/NOP2/fmu family ribosome biogenesis protein
MNNSYFLDEMKQMLNSQDFDRFIRSLSEPLYKALRINRLKADYQTISQEIELLEKTVFDEDTYYLQSEDRPGKHPYHLAGLFYLQEPSASMAVNALDIEEGDWVLDLCAAPGGKSTQILSKLNRTGFLLSNEYERKRANILLSNIERFGCDNYIITNSKVEDLCPELSGVFDKVLVDAPCSGAGMFKKYPDSIIEYSPNLVMVNQKRQLHILDYAYLTLKENGIMVYSTCTFNKDENEEVVRLFLEKYPDMKLTDTDLTGGQPGFDEAGLTRRVFPYQGGEGHFVSRFVKTSAIKSAALKTIPFSKNGLTDSFIAENINEELNYTIINNKIYSSKNNLLDLKANILRSGILLGEIVKNRIEPAHHLFLSDYQFKKVYNTTDFKIINNYLSGLPIMEKGYKGYVQICFKGAAVGFGKGDGVQIKNKFPKGLRIV